MDTEKGRPAEGAAEPTFVRPPTNWAEMTPEQKREWSLSLVRFLKVKASKTK